MRSHATWIRTYKRTELCYQYRCGWDTGVSFIHRVRTQNETIYFCINFPSNAMMRLKAIVKSKPGLLHRDFLVDSLVADDSLKQWQFEIGHRRDTLQIHVPSLQSFQRCS